MTEQYASRLTNSLNDIIEDVLEKISTQFNLDMDELRKVIGSTCDKKPQKIDKDIASKKPVGGCPYVFTKGEKKNCMCGGNVSADKKYCSKHAKYEEKELTKQPKSSLNDDDENDENEKVVKLDAKPDGKPEGKPKGKPITLVSKQPVKLKKQHGRSVLDNKFVLNADKKFDRKIEGDYLVAIKEDEDITDFIKKYGPNLKKSFVFSNDDTIKEKWGDDEEHNVKNDISASDSE
jgi:hypothetical protein